MACSRCGWLHGRAAPISALQVPAQGYVVVHERLGAARQPLSSPPSAPISASMCLRRVSAGRRAAVAISAAPPIRAGTSGRPPPAPPAQFPPPAAAGGSLCRARASEISEMRLPGQGPPADRRVRIGSGEGTPTSGSNLKIKRPRGPPRGTPGRQVPVHQPSGCKRSRQSRRCRVVSLGYVPFGIHNRGPLSYDYRVSPAAFR